MTGLDANELHSPRDYKGDQVKLWNWVNKAQLHPGLYLMTYSNFCFFYTNTTLRNDEEILGSMSGRDSKRGVALKDQSIWQSHLLMTFVFK